MPWFAWFNSKTAGSPAAPAIRLGRLSVVAALVALLLVGDTAACSVLQSASPLRRPRESSSEGHDEAKLETSLMWVETARRACRKGVRGRRLPNARLAFFNGLNEAGQRSLDASIRDCSSHSSCDLDASPLRC